MVWDCTGVRMEIDHGVEKICRPLYASNSRYSPLPALISHPSRHGDTPSSTPSPVFLPESSSPSSDHKHAIHLQQHGGARDGLGTPRTPRPKMLMNQSNALAIRLASRVQLLCGGMRAGGARSRAACCIGAARNAKPGRWGRRYDGRLGLWGVFTEATSGGGALLGFCWFGW